MVDLFELLTSDDDEAVQKSLETEFYPPTSLSEDQADELLGKLLWARGKIEENEERVKAKKQELLARLEDFDQRLNGNLRSFVEYATGELRHYAETITKGKKGSVKLFSGNVTLKESPASFVVDDEEKLTSWLHDNGYQNLLRYSLNKKDFNSKFKKNVQDESLVVDDKNIPGVHVEKKAELTLTISKPRSKKKVNTEDRQVA